MKNRLTQGCAFLAQLIAPFPDLFDFLTFVRGFDAFNAVCKRRGIFAILDGLVEPREAKRPDLLIELVAQDGERLRFRARHENLLALCKQISHQIRDGVGFARARRPENDDVFAFAQHLSNSELILIGGFRKQNLLAFAGSACNAFIEIRKRLARKAFIQGRRADEALERGRRVDDLVMNRIDDVADRLTDAQEPFAIEKDRAGINCNLHSLIKGQVILIF